MSDSLSAYLCVAQLGTMAAPCLDDCISADLLFECRGIFIVGSTILGAAIRTPRIVTKNLIRYGKLID